MANYSNLRDDEGEHNPHFDSRVFVPERRDSDICKRYRADPKEIGSGTFGQVFVAEDRLVEGRYVAIKKVSTPDDETKAAFHREAEIMRELDHPSICKILETHEKRKAMYIVMEYCAGGEVFDRISKHGMIAEHTAAYIISQVASALKYAHGRDIAHRDLKPENMCFCSEKVSDHSVKVIDWGVSFYFPRSGLKRMHSLVGTSTYRAPEVQPAVSQSGYSATCDVWSLGVVTYVMLSGRPPFWGKNQLKKMLMESYPMSGPEWEGISDNAKGFIAGLLKADPSDRFSIGYATQHPWLQLTAEEADPSMMHQTLSNLRDFSNASQLFSICAASVARQLDHRSLEDAYHVFCKMDTNKDGVLEFSEMRSGFRSMFGQDSEELEHLEEIFRRLDLDGSGMIDYTEFCTASVWKRESMQEDVLRAAFKAFDTSDMGLISPEDMKQVLSSASVRRAWPANVCEHAAREVFGKFDQNGDGSLDFDEWVCLMHDCAEQCCQGHQGSDATETGFTEAPPALMSRAPTDGTIGLKAELQPQGRASTIVAGGA